MPESFECKNRKCRAQVTPPTDDELMRVVGSISTVVVTAVKYSCECGFQYSAEVKKNDCVLQVNSVKIK